MSEEGDRPIDDEDARRLAETMAEGWESVEAHLSPSERQRLDRMRYTVRRWVLKHDVDFDDWKALMTVLVAVHHKVLADHVAHIDQLTEVEVDSDLVEAASSVLLLHIADPL